jgi:hypothetical protein
LRQHGGGGGTVTGHIGGLGSDLFHHLGAHVLEFILHLDFLGNGDAVLGDGRGAEGFLDQYVAALGAKGHFYRISQFVDAGEDFLTAFHAEFNVFCCHFTSPFFSLCILAI